MPSMVGMTQTPGPTDGPTLTPASGLDRFFDWLRSLELQRDPEDKWLTGVCAAVARRLDIDPVVVRAAFVLLTLLGGIGITVYLLGWALIPTVRGEILAERAVRHGELGPVLLLVVVGLSLLGGPGFAHDGHLVWLWWLVVPAAFVYWLVTRNRRRSAAGASGAAYATYPPYAPAPYAPAPYATTSPTSSPSAATYGATPTTPTATAPVSPQAAVPPAQPPRPTRPPRAPRPPRRPTAGFLGAVLTAGLAMAAYGIALWIHEGVHAHGSAHVVALGAALAAAGVTVAVFGLTGRRAGLAGLVAVVLAFATWTASVVPTVNLGGGVGERLWRPSAVDQSARYRLGLGSAELNLESVPAAAGSPRAIDVRVGVGQLRIRVPADRTVEVRSSVGVGALGRWLPSDVGGTLTSDTSNSVTGPGGRNLSTVETFGSGAPDVVVTAHVGIGQILIGKE